MPLRPRITLPRPDEVEEEPKPGRSTSAESIAPGWRFIGYGDKLFLTQDYGQLAGGEDAHLRPFFAAMEPADL